MSTPKDQNNPPLADQTNPSQSAAPQTPAPDNQLAELVALVKSQGEQIAALTSAQAAMPAQTAAVDEGGVKVKQWRSAMFGGRTQKIDEQEQYYNKSEFERLTANHPQDKTRSGFEVLGLQYEIIEDTRI